MLLLAEQCLNGLQFGLLLFLLAAGLTLVFGIMDLVNLAHGSLYMVGAYFAATFAALTPGSTPPCRSCRASITRPTGSPSSWSRWASRSSSTFS
jgi:branched-subunit amino acid ABC-type transport system permease component